MIALYRVDFTGEVYHARDPYGNLINEITTTGGWTPFWREDAGAVILRPEMMVIDAVAPFLDPQRTNGVRGLKVFKLFSRHDAGYWRQFSVPVGVTRLRVTARGHHWFSQRDDSYKSEYRGDDGVWRVIRDGDAGATLMVGVDRSGGDDPFAESVAWGTANLYDQFGDVVVDVANPEPLVTVFLRSTQLYPFKHSDAYWADVIVEVEGVQVTCPTPPRHSLRTYNVIPQDATEEEATAIFLIGWRRAKQTAGGSSDDAAKWGGIAEAHAVEWNRSAAEQPAYRAFYGQHYPETVVTFESLESTPDPDPDPDPEPPGWTPTNYVPSGTKLSFHCIGSYPVDRVNALAAQGVTLSSIKLVQAIGDLPITRERFKVGRFIDHPQTRANLEWFDYHGDPEAQAEARMALLMPLFAPYRQYLTHIELINEQDPQSGANHVLLARFYRRAMTIAEQNGYKIALFSHSVGTPEPDEWDAIATTSVFEQAAAGGHAISLHEYGDASYGPGSIICRYRYLYENIILPRALNIPLFLTEYNVRDDMLTGDVFSQWVMYDRLVRQDPYVAGVHIFTLGTGMGWDNYAQATASRLGQFVDYAIAERTVPNG